MKKVAIFCLFASFFLCYLEWGGGNSAFIFEMEYAILFQRGNKLDTFSHPLVLAPFLGQLMVLITLFQKQPSKRMLWAGLVLMGILVLFLVLAGALSRNLTALLSTLPFITSTVWCIRLFAGKKNTGG
jgi:hypothetical protein